MSVWRFGRDGSRLTRTKRPGRDGTDRTCILLDIDRREACPQSYPSSSYVPGTATPFLTKLPRILRTFHFAMWITFSPGTLLSALAWFVYTSSSGDWTARLNTSLFNRLTRPSFSTTPSPQWRTATQIVSLLTD